MRMPRSVPVPVLALAAVVAAVMVAGCFDAGAMASAGATGRPASTAERSTRAPATPASTAHAPSDPEPAPVGEVEEAVVLRVVDGDTVMVDRGSGAERLRYIGIDAPESVKPDTPVEFFGHEASAANEALVEGETVYLERDVSDRDPFDRLLRYVWLRQGARWLLVNLELVRMGYANAVSFPPDVRRLPELRAAERVAREAGIGLWGPATPLP